MLLKGSVPFGVFVVMDIPRATEPRQEANQTVRLDLDRAAGPSSIRISITDQRLTPHGGMIAQLHFLHQKKFRQGVRAGAAACADEPQHAPTDIALGYLGGILAGPKKMRSWWRQIFEKLTAPPNCHVVEALAV